MNKLTKYRWIIATLLLFATTLNYLDRQLIGLLRPTLEVEFNWTEKSYAHIVQGFTIAYAIGLLLFGRIIDRIGSKIGLAISIVVWSLATMLHAAARSTMGFLIARVGLGLGEAGNFPGAIKAVTEWFPKKERALATGIFNSGANLGAIFAPAIVPWIAVEWGWKTAFVITGALGFIWLIAWLLCFKQPHKHTKVSELELQHITSDKDEQAESEIIKISWLKLLNHKQTYSFLFAKFLIDPIWWFFLFWLPSYFSKVFNLNLTELGLPLVIIYFIATIGSVGGGWLSSSLINKGMNALAARKLTLFIFACFVIPVMFIRFTNSLWLVVAIISIAAGAHQAFSANLFTTVSDTFPKVAISSVVGIGGMMGSLGGILFPQLVGVLLDKYTVLNNISAGYNILFIFCGLSYLIAWLCVYLLNRNNERVKIQ